MERELHNPKLQLILLLLLIAFSSFTVYPPFLIFHHLIFSVTFSVIFDLLLTYIKRKRLFVPYAGIVTGLIIGLIISENATWQQIAAITFAASWSKNYLKISHRHIFNPAAFGFIIGGLLFGQTVSWWAVSFQNLRVLDPLHLVSFDILFLTIIVSGLKLHRLYSILTFLFAYTIISFIFTFSWSFGAFFYRLLDPVIIFFSLVMLPEPLTSPYTPKRQIIFGLFVAVLSQIIPGTWRVDIFVTALLAANLIFFKYH